MEKAVIIEGMKCDGCVQTVKEKFSQLPTVSAVDVNLEAKIARITSDENFSLDILNQALAETKFKVTGEK